MLKLKLQYFGHLMRRVDSLAKTLMLGGIGGRRRRGRPRMKRLDGMTDSMDVSLSELRKMVMGREAWRAAIHGIAKSRTWLSDWLNWTEANLFTLIFHFQKVFSSSSRFAIRMVLSAYLRLLMSLLTILIPACTSSSAAFLMVYSAYKLNKQADNIQPWAEQTCANSLQYLLILQTCIEYLLFARLFQALGHSSEQDR